MDSESKVTYLVMDVTDNYIFGLYSRPDLAKARKAKLVDLWEGYQETLDIIEIDVDVDVDG